MFVGKGRLLIVFAVKVALMFIISVQPFFASAQTDEDVIVQADRFFQQGKYPEATRLYSQLLSLHRNDPFYSYRFGVSMLYSDRSDPNATLRYIEAGLGKLKGDDAILINFHLATAYHFTFRFIEALRYYAYFKQQAVHKKFQSYNVNHRIEMCRHGLMLLQNVRDLYVFEKHHVNAESFFRSYNISKFGGKLLVKPDIFKTKFDKKQGDATIIFLSDTQNVVYYSSYGRDGSSGKDIYRSFKMGSGWTSPERLSNVVNTKYDEDYPFILPDGKTLYFSSKGHNSMGGYDVFRSVWDDVQKEWSEPVNLDFAVNTPYDDILFVTDREEKYAYFSSVRGSGLNKINVFLVRIDIRPQDASEDLLAVVTDLGADVTDSGYVEAVRKIQQISNLDVNASQEEFDRKDDDRRKQLYADNYKYNISNNPTDHELIDLTFQYAGDAERTFQSLRQKREAADLSADRYKERAEKYAAEADQLYEQALIETNSERKKDLGRQTTDLTVKATEADLQHKKTVALVGELSKSIDFQSSEYDKIIFRAGEIQRLASGRQIDTSVVLLKLLIDDIKEYEMNISEYIAAVFPTYNVVEQYNKTIAQDQETVKQITDTLKNLAKEKEIYQNELLLVNNPERKENLLIEKTLIEDKIEELQSTRSTLNAEIVENTKARNEVEAVLKSPDYELFAEVMSVEELMLEYQDSVKRVNENPDLITENITKPDPELTANNVTPDNSNINTEKPDSLRTIEFINVNSPLDNETAEIIKKPDIIFVENISNIDIANIQVVDSQDTKNGIVVPVDTLGGALIAENLINEISPDTLGYANVTDTLNSLTHDPVIDTFSVSDPIIIQTERNLVYGDLSSEEKRNVLNGIIEGRGTPRAKTEDLLRFFQEERAVLRVQKQQVNARIAELVLDIDATEKSLTELNQKISEPTLTGIERRKIETEWNGLMHQYESELIELDQLLMISEFVEPGLQMVELLTNEAETASEKIFNDLDEGNEKRATKELSKFTAMVQENSAQLFTRPSSVTLILLKNADQYSSESDRKEELAIKAGDKALLYENKASIADEKADNTKNESRKQKYLNEAELYDTQTEIMRDSVVIYRSEATSLTNRSEGLVSQEKKLIEMTTLLTQVDFEAVSPDNPVIPVDVSSAKIERMKMLIHENPWASGFSVRVSESNQWNYSPDIQNVEMANVRISDKGDSENWKRVYSIIDEIEDAADLKEIADNEQMWVLRSSASIYITRIQQLDEQVALSQNPANTIRLYNERDMLMKELKDFIGRHNTIAEDYPATELLTHETLPLWDELSVDPELSMLAMDKYMNALQHQLDSLNSLLEQSDNKAGKKLKVEIAAIESEMQVYNLKVVEILTVSDRAESTLRSIVIGSIPFNVPDETIQKRFSELDSLRLKYDSEASEKMDLAEGVKSIEQKKALYIEAYDLTSKSLEIQNQMFELYHQYSETPILATDVAERKLALAVSNTDKTSQIVAESVSQKSIVEVITNVTVVTPVIAVSTETPRVEVNNSVVITDRGSENYVAYYSDTNPVPEHIALDGSLLFRVQFAASRRPAANDAYKGMNPIYYEQSDGWYRYMHGEFSELNAATTARNQVRTTGFADAFVVAYYNGKRITIAEARNIIVAQPTITYASVVADSAQTIEEAITTTAVAVSTYENIQFDSVEGFYYAVQVGVYGRTRTTQQLFGIAPLIEDRLGNGNYRYMTGTYATLEDANAARNQIRANGVPDAFVVVYRNGVRISVREAQNYINAGEVPSSSLPATVDGSAITQVIPDYSVRAKNIGFGVQIGAFSREIPEEVMNAFKQIVAGEVMTLTTDGGLYVYASGKFNSPEEAETLKSQLQLGAFPDAFVIAFEGTKKISLQDAKEILQLP